MRLRRLCGPPLLLCSLLLFAPSEGVAQNGVPDLSQVSIEDLMKIEVTSAARKEQRTEDVAAAIFVITHDDIRRSGLRSLPDLLRLVPGVQVAQINANKWAVTVRGFNGLYANKLLVLIDGRSVYNRIFSGVFWDAEDPLLDDIDRIEVIRGPGAALWGANAVNGVINIITDTTATTQGGLARVDAGRFGEQGAARYGGTIGAARYRVYAQWTGRGESLMAPGTSANDGSHRATAGFRADVTTRPGIFSFEGAFTTGAARALWPNLDPRTAAAAPIVDDPSDANGGYLLGRWTRARASGATMQIQSSFDTATRQEPVGNYDRHAFDLDTQYHTALGPRHDLVFGAGYRFIDERFAGLTGVSLTPSQGDSTLLTAFAQDEIALFGRRMALTLGTQVQHDSDFGSGVQPTVRVMWKALPRQRVWAAASSALRTPSLFERGIRVDYPPVATATGLPLLVSIVGNPAPRFERLIDAEVGYRLEIATAASIDVTAYTGHYTHLQTQETAAPIVLFVPSPRIVVVSQFSNQLDANTRGLELAGHWMPTRSWRIDGSYSGFDVMPHLAAASQDPAAAGTDAGAPRAQWQAWSAFSPAVRATVTVALFHVGRLVQSLVEPYTRTDINAEWRFNSRLSAMVIGQNLFDAAHAESNGTAALLLPTQVPRSAGIRLRWTF